MSTWETRELPILRTVRALLSEPGCDAVTPQDVARASGFAVDDVVESLRVLAEAKGPYVSGRGLVASDDRLVVTGLTDRAFHELSRFDDADVLDFSTDPPAPSR